ncbi:hypothetical protein FOA52_002974 [Chlamydomonas sp. UWO 241]|nr:hypothetical protein FOA52_002974 [Chlamydomonas sp. UWO 241]
MAGSRRRLKRNAPKVKVGGAAARRKQTEKTKVPLEVTENRPGAQKRLKRSLLWSEEANLTDNYRANDLLLDINAGFGRNNAHRGAGIRSAEVKETGGEETFEDDDELRAACNLERKTGKALPPRLTSHQRDIFEKLLAAHGDDVDAMVLDIKLNKMQHSAGQLRKLLEGHRHWGEGSRHDFRAPRKAPKRI